MLCRNIYYYYLNWKFSYGVYKYIYQFLSCTFISDPIIWWAETGFDVKPWLVKIVSAYVHLFILHTVASWLLKPLTEE